MDSLTQIVLGAAVGEAVLGKKVGNKAMLYGAIAGTIPDLDVLASYVTDTVTALQLHRGFTHSVLFSIVFAPIFAWLITRYERYKNVKDWAWLFFLAFVTHPILDAHTTWGTQLFWPLDTRLAFKTIFVIDPLYTLPFIVCLVLTMFQQKDSKKRRFYNTLGLGISSAYLALTFIFKAQATRAFTSALQEQNISYSAIDTRPSALNTILWNANIKTSDGFLIANYSLLDTQPIQFTKYPKQHDLLGDLRNAPKVQQMIKITNGWFNITTQNDTLFFNDLRFGKLSLNPNVNDFVFQYQLSKSNADDLMFTEIRKRPKDGKLLLQHLWQRLKGN